MVKYLLFLAFLLNASLGALVAQDVAAFQALYAATGGDGWHVKPVSNTNPCQMNSEGRKIYCYKNRITEILLRGNNLIGTIPTELASLTALKILDLRNNPELTGTLPAYFGSFLDLRTIRVDKCAMTGTIPTEVATMASLNEFIVQYNQMNGTVPTFTNPNLNTLLLGFNKFCPIQNYALFASNTDYTGEPCGCATNPCVRGTCLPGFTEGDYTCDCSGTGYFGATCDATSADESDFLTLETATGGEWSWRPNSAVPICLSGWRVQCDANGFITELNLSNNGLKGTIPDFSSLTQLKYLDLSDNALYGTIPVSLFSLTSLVAVDLSGNTLKGGIPTQIGSLTSLSYFDVASNLLSTSLPAQLGSLTALNYMDLSSNFFTGAIPTQIGLLTSLKTLRMNTNKLSGVIPTQIGALTSLVELSLHENELTGGIPSQFSALTSAKIMRLRNNLLSGGTPTAISAIGLEFLELTKNGYCATDYSSWASVYTDHAICSA